MGLLDQNTLLTLNRDPKSIDLHKLALARMKNTKVNPEARHYFITDRARKKNIKDIDQLFQHLNELKKNGVLDLWMEKYGDMYGYSSSKRKQLKENIEYKIESLIENYVASGVGPIATYGGEPSKNKQIINIYPGKCTHQDPGAEKEKNGKCKK
jgi:hypothetical protein